MKILVWLTLCAIWGTTWIFIKVGLEDLPPISFAAARFLLAIVILSVIVKIQKIPLPRTPREWRLVVLTGILQFSINYGMVFWSEQYITSGLAAVLQAMITVFGLMLAWYFLPNERVTWLKIFSVALGIIGVAVIFIDQLKVQSWMAFWGCVGIVAGSYAAAQSSILVKSRGSGIQPAAMLLCQMFCGLPAILIYSILAEGNPFEHNWTIKAIGCVLYLSIPGTIVAFWLYYWLLGRIESTKAMMISLVTPLLAVFVGWLAIGEKLPPQTTFGGILIVSSIGLIVYRKKDLRPANVSERDLNQA